MKDIQVIAFDADDTLWVNEPYFREAEEAFCEAMQPYFSKEKAMEALFSVEMKNLPLYGYGIKGFMLSMTETAAQLSGETINTALLTQLLDIGKQMFEKPVILLEDVEEVLEVLQHKYRLVMATKGDLLDQQRKLQKSGLSAYFHHIEIMSEKRVADYQSLIRHQDILPQAFMMVGNSLRSDVLPVLETGAHAVHIPFHITWAHEQVEEAPSHPHFKALTHLKELLNVL